MESNRPASVISESLKRQIENRLEQSYNSFHSKSSSNYNNLTGQKILTRRSNTPSSSKGRPVRAKTAGPGVRSAVRHEAPRPEELNLNYVSSYNDFALPATNSINYTTQYQATTSTSDFNNTNDLVNFVTNNGQLNDINRVLINNAAAQNIPTTSNPNFNYELRQSDVVKTVAYRPMTSNLFRVPYNLGDPIGITHYDDTFYKKDINRREPIRTGTSSGNRNNNPHPSQEFMVFRFRPMKTIKNPNSLWSRPIGDRLIEQAIKNQMKSTYASDYVNNVDAKAKFEEEAKHLQHIRPHKKGKHAPVDNTKFDQFVYNNPFSYESLAIAPTRYGSNINHQKAAVGIVPGVPSYWLNLP